MTLYRMDGTNSEKHIAVGDRAYSCAHRQFGEITRIDETYKCVLLVNDGPGSLTVDFQDLNYYGSAGPVEPK